jgi:hypothetical protein
MKKYRKKKCTESQQLNSSMQDGPTGEMKNRQLKENNAGRKRAIAKELSRRFREKKRFNVLKSVHHVVHDSQIPGPSHENPPLVLRNQRTTIHDSQIAGTSTNMSISLVVRNNLKKYTHWRKSFVTIKRRKSARARRGKFITIRRSNVRITYSQCTM